MAVESRETALAEVCLALENLTAATTALLLRASSLEGRLLNRMTPPESPPQKQEIAPPLPIFAYIEERVTGSLGRIQEAYDILVGIEKELS